MDLSGCSFMELDPESLSGVGDGSPMDFDHVGWQGSQTANHALNQLIRSSVNDPALAKENVDVNGSSSRGWQREPSFDQIPGFSLLSTKDSSSGNLASSSKSSSTFQTPQPLPFSRPSITRSRPSEAKSSRSSLALAGTSNASLLPPIASSSSSSSLSIPFFDKTNPSQFLDILKGVSARVDANAGVRPRSSTGGIDTSPSFRNAKGRKRLRGTSLGEASDSLAAKIKKGRIEALRESAGVNPKAKDRDKGKERVRNEVGDVGRGVCGDDGSAQGIIAGVLGTSSWDREETDDMDVDNGRDEWSMIDTSGHSRDDCNSSGTSSQTKMPPPPAPVPPVKHPSTTTSRALPISISSTSTASSSSATSRPTFASHSTHIHKEPTPKDIKPPTTSQTPKYHPLLLQPPAKPAPNTSLPSHARQSNHQPKHPPPPVQATSIQPNSTQHLHPKIKSEPRQGHVPPPAPAGALPQTSKLRRSVTVSIPSPSPAAASAPLPIPPSTSQIPSSQSSRPPALGMRRTHTLPSSSSAFSSSTLTSSKMVPSLQKSGVLPTKQRGFKPPLLSSSQPQAPSQSQLSHASAQPRVTTTDAKNFATTRIYERSGGSNAHIQPSKQSHNAVLKAPTSSNGSTSSASDSPHSRGGGRATGPPSSSLSRSTSDSPASSSGASSSSLAPASKMAGSRDRSLKVSGCKATADKRDGRSSESPTRAPARNRPPATKAPSPSPPPPAPAPVVAPKSLPASPPLPEPADGDPDSSFGDMSFDMDALEETMRQYD